MADIDKFLKEREATGCLRSLRPISARRESAICSGSKEYIDFSSNDYLGLAGHPKLKDASKEAIDKFGAGASASRLLSGSLAMHHSLEEAVAKFKHKEAALVFNSGYQANVGIISSLYSKDDCVFSDRLNHASIIDGVLLSGAKIFRFLHNDLNHLESLLKSHRPEFKKALIVTETIFSMDGDRPPLKELVKLKNKYNCDIMADEAHATGIYGADGSGVVEEEGLSREVDLIMGTFSKALGSFGAYLATSKKIVDYLINTCRGFIYSTALPPAVIAANLAAIKLVGEEPQRRARLLESAGYFRSELRKMKCEIRGASQIIPLMVGENHRAVKMADKLQAMGYWILPIRPPTVPKGEARLRFSLTSHHDQRILRRIIDDIAKIGI